jgi:hypothetical protein
MLRPLIVVLTSALLAAAVFEPVAMAQRGSGLGMRGASAHSGFGHSARGSFNGRHSRWFGSDAIFLGEPFYADYPDASLTIPSQFVEVPPTATATPPETKAQPLMIELQGDRYVRFGGREQPAERGTNTAPDYAEVQAGNNTRVPQQQAHAELPTVLIFRDGHREQIPEYAIVGSTLYASGDYWQSGQWTKNIQLSALDIPATMKANHDNGVNFTLPSAPNEIVTRP